MEHFVTLFDSTFLPQGLALHASLQRQAPAYTLWVLCMDEPVQACLDRLALPNLKTIALAEVESQWPQLLDIKKGRNRAEYCWTLTPLTPKLVFDRCAEAQRATYVDADMYFFRPPGLLLQEFARSGKAVQITDHAYHARYDQSTTSGRFCVQFVTFVREAGESVRAWWQDRCFEWCFARVEAGRFGDQKYLDDWPTRFPDQVHVLTQLELLQAPWNALRFSHALAVAWHFHGLRLLAEDKVLLHSGYEVPAAVDADVYGPYVRELRLQSSRWGQPIVQANLPSKLWVVARAMRHPLRTLGEVIRGEGRVVMGQS